MNGNEILYVEDCEDDLLLFKHNTKHFGMNVQSATSLREAREKVTNYPKFRFVFVDLRIQNEDSMPFVRWLKTKFPYIPIIILTGNKHLRQEHEREIADLTPAKVFVKPFTSIDMASLMPLKDITSEVWSMARPKRSAKTTALGSIAGAFMVASYAGKAWILDPNVLVMIHDAAILCLCLGLAFAADSAVLVEAIGRIASFVATSKTKKD